MLNTILSALLLCSPCQVSGGLTIWVSKKHSPGDHLVAIDLNSDATVTELKERIAAHYCLHAHGVTPASLFLEHSGQPLNDLGQSLADEGLCADTHIEFHHHRELKISFSLSWEFCLGRTLPNLKLNVPVGHDNVLPYIQDEIERTLTEEEKARIEDMAVSWTFIQKIINQSGFDESSCPVYVRLSLDEPRFRAHFVDNASLISRKLRRVVQPGEPLLLNMATEFWDNVASNQLLAFGELDDVLGRGFRIIDDFPESDMAEPIGLWIYLHVPEDMNLVFSKVSVSCQITNSDPTQSQECTLCVIL